MSLIEDKILGNNAGYCSSSDEEEESTGAAESENPHLPTTAGCSTNTGPKGVIEDWRRFKQLETERRDEQARELLVLAKKLTLTCRTPAEDVKAREKEAEDELFKEVLSDEDFFEEYVKNRMAELHSNLRSNPGRFGMVFELVDVDAFLQATEQESKKYTVLIHIYEQLCNALPTIQAYRDAQLIGNFVRLTDELGDDFFADDLETFLEQYGILPDHDDVIQILGNTLS